MARLCSRAGSLCRGRKASTIGHCTTTHRTAGPYTFSICLGTADGWRWEPLKTVWGSGQSEILAAYPLSHTGKWKCHCCCHSRVHSALLCRARETVRPIYMLQKGFVLKFVAEPDPLSEACNKNMSFLHVSLLHHWWNGLRVHLGEGTRAVDVDMLRMKLWRSALKPLSRGWHSQGLHSPQEVARTKAKYFLWGKWDWGTLDGSL